MSRATTITFLATLIATGCSEYSVSHDSVNAGPLDETLGEQTDAGAPGDGTWEDETDPEGSGGGSGAIRPDDPTDPPADETGDPEESDDPTDPPDTTDTVDPEPETDDPEPDEPDLPEDEEDPEYPPEEGTTPDPGDEPDGGVSNGRMTGGGSAWVGEMRVTHGMTLHCDPNANNRLQINWDGGKKYHLDHLIEVECFDDKELDPGMPSAGFDTMWAIGVGRDGSEIELWVTDDGEPGTTDVASFLIQDDQGVILDVSSELDRGNHQAHGQGNVNGTQEGSTQAMTRQGCSTTSAAPWTAGAWLGMLLLAARRR
jgi:hypothetical protein